QPAPPNPDRDCILLDHDLFDEVSNDLGSFCWERLRAVARRVARSSIFRVWSLGVPAGPKRSSNIAGLVRASARTLITASSISWAGSRQPWARSVPASVIRAVET